MVWQYLAAAAIKEGNKPDQPGSGNGLQSVKPILDSSGWVVNMGSGKIDQRQAPQQSPLFNVDSDVMSLGVPDEFRMIAIVGILALLGAYAYQKLG